MERVLRPARALKSSLPSTPATLSRSKPASRPRPPPSPPPPQLDVLYDGPAALVLNKRAGEALMGQKGSPAYSQWLASLAALRKREGCADARPVHRLDKSVSGCLLFAKSSLSASRLSQQLQRHDVQRTYLAVVHGKLKQGYTGEIDARLRMDDDRVRVCEEGEGVEAKTVWECLAASNNYSLLLLTPKTGRKHQLRVHCADVLRAPIVGDFKLSPAAPHSAALEELSIPLDNVLLHASSLSFYAWQKNGKRETINVDSSPPPFFQRFCRAHKLALPRAEKHQQQPYTTS